MGKKTKKETVKDEKRKEDLFLEQLRIIVAARLQKEKWDEEDQRMKKKKLTKAEKARINYRREEELKQALEIERVRVIEEEKKQKELERIAAIAKEENDDLEHIQRLEQIKETNKLINVFINAWNEYTRKTIAEFEWQEYVKCDGLPNSFNFGEMSTYLHLWDKIKENTTEQQAFDKTTEVMTLLDTLEEVALAKQLTDCQKNLNLVHIRDLYRTYEKYNLDCVSYRLLRDISNKLQIRDVSEARRVVTHPNGYFTLCVWALVQLPIPMPNIKRPGRKPPLLQFPEIFDMEVQFPDGIDMWAKCVRGMYCTFEHFSHLCRSKCAPTPDKKLTMSLDQLLIDEYEQKQQIKNNMRAKIKLERDEEAQAAFLQNQSAETEQTKVVLQNALRRQKEYINVDASEIYCTAQDADFIKQRNELKTIVGDNVINLRRYRILGGVFSVELFYQPPQPTTMIITEISFVSLKIPKWLEPVPFHYKFSPPPPVEAGVVRKPEEIEEELRLVEIEYEQLLHFSLKLPSTVLWLDPPIVCQWDDVMHAWTTADIHDAKYNEEKQTVQFKAGRFGAIAMAVYMYNSMPFQAWELKPISGNRVVLTIIAAVLIAEFTFSGYLVCLSQLQNAPSAALDHLVGKYMSVLQLQRALINGGADFFPSFDSFCYIDGVSEKHWPMEKHLYYNMAQCSLFFNFAWSRWNVLAGRRSAVFQMREWKISEKGKQQNYSMAMVTPLKAILVDCSEVSQVFNEEGIKKMKFYADLYHLVLGITTVTMKCKLEKVPLDVINTVAQFLCATRVLSLS